jgi:hypothetical protein
VSSPRSAAWLQALPSRGLKKRFLSIIQETVRSNSGGKNKNHDQTGHEKGRDDN